MLKIKRIRINDFELFFTLWKLYLTANDAKIVLFTKAERKSVRTPGEYCFLCSKRNLVIK